MHKPPVIGEKLQPVTSAVGAGMCTNLSNIATNTKLGSVDSNSIGLHFSYQLFWGNSSKKKRDLYK